MPGALSLLFTLRKTRARGWDAGVSVDLYVLSSTSIFLILTFNVYVEFNTSKYLGLVRGKCHTERSCYTHS